ncbi:hypothetical protein O5O45_20980 [Hahella aquimaris]|nr:hypothetical protein [Hahella sp. HNIBRBA332]WLQ12202.1 hypothetical protein O5O45_20980 [Hahella sp. HNIBRBA332]
MKRKPDVMLTLVIVFCLGLVVSGFTTFGHKEARTSPTYVSVAGEDVN